MTEAQEVSETHPSTFDRSIDQSINPNQSVCEGLSVSKPIIHQCTLCRKIFAQRSNLRRHLRNIHSVGKKILPNHRTTKENSEKILETRTSPVPFQGVLETGTETFDQSLESVRLPVHDEGVREPSLCKSDAVVNGETILETSPVPFQDVLETDPETFDQSLESLRVPAHDEGVREPSFRKRDAVVNECTLCGKNFSQRASLRRHQRTLHGVETFRRNRRKGEATRTKDTGGKFPDVLETKTLNQSALEEGPSARVGTLQCESDAVPAVFECPLCGKNFAQRANLRRHERTLHSVGKTFHPDRQNGDTPGKRNGRKALKCSECQQHYSSTLGLQRHVARVHSKKKSFECDVCKKTFFEKTDLCNHIRVHTGERPFECEICQKRFSKSGLYTHRRIHTGEKPYHCEVCAKQFRSKHALNIHMQSHTGVKPFQCETCLKKFSERAKLKVHKRVHSGEKLFKCEVCSRTFREKATLQRHTQIHTGERPYECDKCLKQFRSKTELVKHLCPPMLVGAESETVSSQTILQHDLLVPVSNTDSKSSDS